MTTLLEPATIADPLLAPMPRRPLGRLPWSASVLTLGGVAWDTLCTDSVAAELIHRALELGINTFDTAWAYGEGESERKLGLALEGRRGQVWINTKTIDRSYDGAMRQIETSLARLRTDRVDLMFVHSLDNEEQFRQILAPDSVLKAIDEFRAAGQIRYVGVSGHWVKHLMARIIQEYPFDAVLFPAGYFNAAYRYNFVDEVLPIARRRGMAVLGMKILGAGRVRHARSIEPYLRYSLNLPIDTVLVGSDSIRQLEEAVRIAKSQPTPLTEAEEEPLRQEALAITQAWDKGEFAWVEGYPKPE